MNVTVCKSNICGSVCVPPSKSVAHRLMIAAALAGSSFAVKNGGKDILATAECLEIMSQRIKSFVDGKRGGSRVEGRDISKGEELAPCNAVRGDAPQGERLILNAGESGSTLRFLLPIVCALGLNAEITGEGRLKDRPLDGLIKSLADNGASIKRVSEEGLPLHVGGRLRAGEFQIDGRVSSQYVTGLLFALPLLDGDSGIEISGGLVSANYVDITLGVLEEFGIEIKKTPSGFYVKGNQSYILPDRLSVEGDWSSAAFMLALGVLGGEVKVQGLKENSLQGDIAVVRLLRRAGADIRIDGGEVVAKRSDLHAIDFDAEHCPDIVPIMAAALSFAEGVSRISSVDRLRDKESDRLSAIMTVLDNFGVRTAYEDGALKVYGGAHRACRTQGFSDHRMAMSAIVIALNTDGESFINGVECISKSYPAFIEHAVSMGADIRQQL